MSLALVQDHLAIDIRPMKRGAEDGFVLSSWKKSYREFAYPWVPISYGPFYHWMSNHVDKLVDKADILMAVDPDDEGLLLGWICTQGRDTLHYVYVKRPFRKASVAMRLIGASGLHSPLVLTHWTKFAEHLQSTAEAKVLYQPSRLEKI